VASSEEQLLELTFPHLATKGYRITSPASSEYNCIAWAVGSTEQNWDYSRFAFGYWPSRLSRDSSIATLINVFATVGYALCYSGETEAGFEKIAIYSVDGMTWTHAARQLENGRWSSKLGRLQDIEHDSLDAINCPDYGSAIAFVKRKRQA
jgi:hypothetical protein